jgi:hypothetical protein
MTNGAQVNSNANGHDPRVTAGVNWMWPTIGALVVGLQIWLITSVNETNINIAKLIVRMDSKDGRDDRQDNQIQENTRGLAEVRGKVLRGIADGKDVLHEP